MPATPMHARTPGTMKLFPTVPVSTPKAGEKAESAHQSDHKPMPNDPLTGD